MGRHWIGPEVTAACKAYAKATLNPLVGADQDIDKFCAEVAQRMGEFVPPNVEPGMFHHRGMRIYPYLRDNVFPQLQKFNKCLRHIYACNPTGVTEQQKINMAVALFKKVAKGMDYEYKEYDTKNWKMYAGWLAVRHLPKFQFESSNAMPQNSVMTAESTESDDPPSSGAEVVETRMPSRGTKRGRDNAKALETELAREKQREAAMDARVKEMQKGMQEISAAMRRRNSAQIIVEALRVATDATQKQKLQEKLVAMALEL